MSQLNFPSGSVVKNLPASVGDARDAGSIPVSGRPPAGRNGNSLQYSCLEDSTDSSLMGYSLWGPKESDMTGHARRLDKIPTNSTNK